MDQFTCPRCHGGIPSNEHRGEWAGAASRAVPDRDIEICSACGSDEATREHQTGVMIPVAQWPVRDAHAYAPEVAL